MLIHWQISSSPSKTSAQSFKKGLKLKVVLLGWMEWMIDDWNAALVYSFVGFVSLFAVFNMLCTYYFWVNQLRL